MSRLWDGDEGAVKDYVASRFTHVDGFPAGARALGWVNVDSRGVYHVVGGVVLAPRGGGFDAELSIAIEPECRISPGHLKTLFRVVFDVFGLKRVTCHIAKGNKPAIRFVERLGFRREGNLRRGYDGHQRALVYGMTADECRWLK